MNVKWLQIIHLFRKPQAEIEYDQIDQIRGMDVCIVTTAKNQEEGFSLLKHFGLPFKR